VTNNISTEENHVALDSQGWRVKLASTEGGHLRQGGGVAGHHRSQAVLPGVKDGSAIALKEVFVSGQCRIDILCVDVDGTITLCECKLQTSTEMRRTIVGQLTAYAAALWKISYEDFERMISAKLGTNLASRMEQLVGESGNDWTAGGFYRRYGRT
jgi:hypothetical protein